MKIEEYFDKMQEKVERLNKILKERDYGLFTWGLSVGKSMEDLIDFWQNGGPSENSSKNNIVS